MATDCLRDHLQEKRVGDSELEARESPKESVQMGSPEPKYSPRCPLGLQLPILHPAMQGSDGNSKMAARLIGIDPRLFWICG